MLLEAHLDVIVQEHEYGNDSPQFRSANDSLWGEAGSQIETRGSEWILLTRAAPGEQALFVGLPGLLEQYLISRRYAKLIAWCPLPDHRSDVVSGHGRIAALEFLSMSEIIQRLSDAAGNFDLVVVDFRRVGRAPQINLSLVRKLLGEIATALGADGECCVVSDLTPSFMGLRLQTRSRYPTLPQVSRLLERFTHIQRYIPHPSVGDPEEIHGLSHGGRLDFASAAAQISSVYRVSPPLYRSLVAVASLNPQTSFLESVLAEALKVAGLPERATIDRCLTRPNGTVTLLLSQGDRKGSVLRLPLNRHADLRIRDAWNGLSRLQDEIAWLSDITPALLSRGTREELPWYLESRCVGMPAELILRRQGKADRLQQAILDFLIEFSVVDDRPLPRDEVSDLVNRLTAPVAEYLPDTRTILAGLSVKLVDAVTSAPLKLVRVHGDFNQGNILCDESSGTVTGLIDWDACQARGLPLQDIVHFVIDHRRGKLDLSLGEAVVSALGGTFFENEDARLVNEYAHRLTLHPRQNRALLAMYWLRHVCLHLKYRNGELASAWVQSNLQSPLAAISEMDF